ncbi:MAG: hypothetical protein ABSA81_06715 [Candidatus Bathyarchaeia archaeon]
MIPAEISKKRVVPLAATFAAVYAILRLMPIFVMIGGSGRVFSTTEFVAPLLGIILGPYVGSVAGLIGTFLGIMLTGRMNFFGLDFLPIMMNAAVLGLLMRRKMAPALASYSALIVLFFAHPSTLHFVSMSLLGSTVSVPFIWLHILTWILLASPLSRKSIEWISGESEKKRLTAACVLSLIGTTAQHLTGTLLFASMAVPLMGMSPNALQVTWTAVFYTYPIDGGDRGSSQDRSKHETV